MKHQAFAALLLIAVSGAVLPGLTGCAGKLNSNKSSENALVIPDFPTAQEQFQFARVYQNSQLVAPELKRRKEQMQKIGECYHRVITTFPNDPVWVPLSYLELGDCAAQTNEFALAIQYYQQAQAATQDDFVNARARYSTARIYDSEGRYEDAKAIYKSIMESYGNTQSGKVKDVVNRSTQLYLKVHEKK